MVLPPTYLTRRRPQRVFKDLRNTVYRNKEILFTEKEKYLSQNQIDVYLFFTRNESGAANHLSNTPPSKSAKISEKYSLQRQRNTG